MIERFLGWLMGIPVEEEPRRDAPIEVLKDSLHEAFEIVGSGKPCCPECEERKREEERKKRPGFYSTMNPSAPSGSIHMDANRGATHVKMGAQWVMITDRAMMQSNKGLGEMIAQLGIRTDASPWQVNPDRTFRPASPWLNRG